MGKVIKRKWGTYEVLKEDKDLEYKVKILTILPKRFLCDQLHRHRSETWCIVSGSGRFSQLQPDRGSSFEYSHVSEGDVVEFYDGWRHRLENDGKIPLVLVEIQEGRYLEEDDIVRFEDYPDDWDEAFDKREENRNSSGVIHGYYEN